MLIFWAASVCVQGCFPHPPFPFSFLCMVFLPAVAHPVQRGAFFICCTHSEHCSWCLASVLGTPAVCHSLHTYTEIHTRLLFLQEVLSVRFIFRPRTALSQGFFFLFNFFVCVCFSVRFPGQAGSVTPLFDCLTGLGQSEAALAERSDLGFCRILPIRFSTRFPSSPPTW